MPVLRHKKVKTKKSSVFTGFKDEVANIILLALAVLMWWNIFFPPDGQFGIILNKILTITFGSLAGIFPIILIYAAFTQMLKNYWHQPSGRVEAVLVLYLALLGGAHLLLPMETHTHHAPWAEFFAQASLGVGGGYIGAVIAGVLWWAVGRSGSFILVGLVIMLALLGIGRQPLLNKIRLFLTYIFSSKQRGRAKKAPASKLKRERKKVKIKQEKAQLKELTSKPEEKAKQDQVLKKLDRPTLDLLADPKNDTNERKENRSDLLADTLASFGVEAIITGYICGPTLTRYEVMPGLGVKVKQIENLADDIALALAARSVRIEAPIPGKRAVGIEVPNEVPGTVYLKEVLNTTAFLKGNSPLLIGIGKDIGGQSVVADLKDLIHLLVAGATGSGKSVCINSMLISLLIKATPEELRLLLIDPKRIELSLYEGIPHLLTPVVTDPKEAAKALRWAVTEMEDRYIAFEEVKVRDLTSYNKKALQEGKEVLPHIVIVIDELADLMMVASAEVEEAICRLAQKARAAGMHLIVATQRPSTDVVTGLIKANIPSRIAFAVSSGTDSSIILDTRGAEKLLGKGDMLFYPLGLAKPYRLQGAYVSDRDVEQIVMCWKEQGNPDYVDLKVEDDTLRKAFEAKDELLPQAARIVIQNERASASYLQRHLRIGYTRAARLIDIMESLGIVGPYQGSKPRDILVSESELEEILKEY